MRTVLGEAAHVVPLLARMRPADALLANAQLGIGVVLTLIGSIGTSGMTWCGLDEAGPVILGGVVPHGSDGFVWQAAAPALALHKRAYLRQGRALLHETRHFRRLWTNIRASYQAALRHARRFGFIAVSSFDLVGVPMVRCERVQQP